MLQYFEIKAKYTDIKYTQPPSIFIINYTQQYNAKTTGILFEAKQSDQQQKYTKVKK